MRRSAFRTFQLMAFVALALQSGAAIAQSGPSEPAGRRTGNPLEARPAADGPPVPAARPTSGGARDLRSVVPPPSSRSELPNAWSYPRWLVEVYAGAKSDRPSAPLSRTIGHTSPMPWWVSLPGSGALVPPTAFGTTVRPPARAQTPPPKPLAPPENRGPGASDVPTGSIVGSAPPRVPTAEKSAVPDAGLWTWIGLGGAAIALLVLFRSLFRRKPQERKQGFEEPRDTPKASVPYPAATRLERTASGQSPRSEKPRPEPQPARFKADGDRAWVPVGKAARFGEWTVAGPAYVGSVLRPAHGLGTRDNCLIDPALPVASRADAAGQHMDYWPSYESMKPSCRRAFLEWMALPRSAPDAYIGYVFVYFYGLERRAILERSQADRPAVKAEVLRLLEIYGSNKSFRRYASELLAATEVLDVGPEHDPIPLYEPAGGDVPASVKIALGRRMKNGRAVEPERLLSLVMSHPETRVRTPARRAFPQLQEMFRTEYHARHPQGLMFASRGLPAARIVYRSASGTFVSDLTEHLGTIPDASKHATALELGREILDACSDRLEEFSRFVGKAPELADSLHAIALLPPEQRAGAVKDIGGDTLAWLRDRAERQVVVPAAELFRRTTGSVPEKITSAKIRDLADTLAKFGACVVPDLRFSVGAAVNGDLLLFALEKPTEKLQEVSTAYRTALLILSLGMLVALADGAVDEEERQALDAMRRGAAALAPDERRRLAADLRWLELHPLELAALRKRLSSIPPADREKIAGLLVKVAAVGGVRHSSEVALLERVYRQLDLDPERLYSGLHRTIDAAVSRDEPVTVARQEPAKGYAIPERPAETGPARVEETAPPPKQPTPQPDRLESIRAETQAVTLLLTQVFAEPEDQGAGQAEPPPEAADDTDRLPPRLMRLLDQVLLRHTWPPAEFERLARELDLVPGAAMEELNAWAYETHDDVLLEDGDPILVHRALLIGQFSEAAE
jgi:uncharacterized tellurite resistance protein B-like protein